MRYAARTDANHATVRNALRKAGHFVVDTSGVGNGFPDLLVHTRNGQTLLFEVKPPGKYRLTDSQKKFHKNYPGDNLYIVQGIQDALDSCLNH